MFVLIRLYRFHRRCGMARRHALHRAVLTTLSDIHIKRRSR